MAVLTNQDYGELRLSVYRQGLGKEELKAELTALPDKSTLTAMFQDIEDSMTSLFTSPSASGIKTIIDSSLGVTTTQTLASKIFAGYLKWKIRQVLGG